MSFVLIHLNDNLLWESVDDGKYFSKKLSNFGEAKRMVKDLQAEGKRVVTVHDASMIVADVLGIERLYCHTTRTWKPDPRELKWKKKDTGVWASEFKRFEGYMLSLYEHAKGDLDRAIRPRAVDTFTWHPCFARRHQPWTA